MNGRHFLMLGAIACAGLVSVRDGQQQVQLRYEIGALERDLHAVREDIEYARIRHRSLQSPRAVTRKADELELNVGPSLHGGFRGNRSVPDARGRTDVLRTDSPRDGSAQPRSPAPRSSPPRSNPAPRAAPPVRTPNRTAPAAPPPREPSIPVIPSLPIAIRPEATL